MVSSVLSCLAMASGDGQVYRQCVMISAIYNSQRCLVVLSFALRCNTSQHATSFGPLEMILGFSLN